MSVATSIPFPQRQQWNDHGSIAVIGADNMGYTTHMTQVRVEDNQMVQYNQINTINIWQRWNDANLFPKFKKLDHLFGHITGI